MVELVNTFKQVSVATISERLIYNANRNSHHSNKLYKVFLLLLLSQN